MRCTIGFALAAGLVVVAAGCGKKDGTDGGGTTTPASIDGAYLIIGMEMKGEKMPDEMFAKGSEEERTMTIKGDKLTSK